MLQPLLMPLSKPTSKRKSVNLGSVCRPKKEKEKRKAILYLGGLAITIIRSGRVNFWPKLMCSNSAVNLLL